MKGIVIEWRWWRQNAFCGRVPRSVLARHYTDFSPERLKRIYDNAGLRVLD